ncbi:unnamed protein product [Trichogramma brassicae]|uniref:DNA repair protein complementing XP-G cells homolog n=1 Tax=Trichogramma brassicae TaxID=86971 RepID=A0A6H5ITT0_9HYME|nr:unnamed protein product [Trichogramma brassicae]
MGVLGLWKLLDATGKPVPLETLEGKVLAVDVSIWIHQVIQGYQDRRGSMLPNAHLIGLFNRICKLLYFKIKPVFVFDGGVPLLKKNTIANRRKLKSIAASKAQKLKNDLINNLIKHTAIQGAIEKDDDNNDASSSQSVFKNSSLASSSQQPDLYKLPDIPIPIQPKDSDDYIDSDDEPSPRKQTKWAGNIHSVDITTEDFRNLPADVRYDILTDLKETRKQSSWGRMHELPAGSDNYSGFQVGRLLKRRTVQESLEIAEKEMGGKTLTLEELDRLLTDQGISTTQQDTAFRIASDSTTRVVYIKGATRERTTKLQNNLGKLERQAVDITEQMRSEAQELLRLFGLPYIVAPMEAEAQCAYLEQIKLVDGTITDDSDVWLFGSHCVYKNFFDNNKRVLQFLSDDIEHHFKLTRKEMILLALLVGSDYTNGLAGVGPVTGLEILASFPTEGEDILRGLRSFCAWFRAGRLSAPTKSTLRNKLKNIQIEKGFPSQAVVQAYLCPTIDESRDEFSWGKPNLVLLADYVKQKFGWTKLKFDEIMNPVLKKMAEGKSQKGISSYFKVKTVPKSIEAALSKRVQNAVHKLHGKGEESDDEASTSSVKEKPKRAKKTSSKSQEKTVESTEEVSTSGVEKPKRVRKTTAKKRKSTKDELDQAEEVVPDPEAKEKYHEVEDGKVASQSENETTVTVRVKKAKLDEDDPEKKLQEHMEKIRQRRPLKGEVDDYIPQRERDKANALKVKLKAIEIFRKSKISPSKATLRKRAVRKVKKDAELSESSSDE